MLDVLVFFIFLIINKLFGLFFQYKHLKQVIFRFNSFV